MLIEKRNFLHACVNVPVYIMYVCAGACRVQKAWDPLKLELEAFMSRLKWRLVLLSLLPRPKGKNIFKARLVHTNTTHGKNRARCPGMTEELCYIGGMAQTCEVSQRSTASVGVYFVVL